MTLIIDHLSKQFAKHGQDSVESLDAINVEIRDGEFICITWGPASPWTMLRARRPPGRARSLALRPAGVNRAVDDPLLNRGNFCLEVGGDQGLLSQL